MNLALSVGPALPPGDPHAGMHPIASWMHAIDLCDTVDIEPLGGGTSAYQVVCEAPAGAVDWPPDKDLGVRAHRLVQKHIGREWPVRLGIAKRIPAGGGMGGGSSDAAAVMLGLNEAFEVGAPIPRLAEWSRELGSDIAFFLDEPAPPRPAIVTGLGDRVDRIAPSPGWAVLVLPPFGCPTGSVYGRFDAGSRPRLNEAAVRSMAATAIEDGSLFNDLTSAAIAVEPRLGALIELVGRSAGCRVHMSGSGSTLFVLAAEEGASSVIGAKIRAGVPDVTVAVVRLV